MYVTHIQRNNPVFKVKSVTENLTIKKHEQVIKLLSIGKRGVPGAGDKNYVKNFTASNEVTVDHNLGKYPSISVFDSAGDEVIGSVEHVSLNQLIARFTAPFTGKITCN